ARRGAGGLRRHGRGQVDAARPRAALLRPDGRCGGDRRPRPALAVGRRRACRDRAGDAAADPVLRHAARESARGPILFSAPLCETLLAGGADAPWEDVERACEIAGVTSFLPELPDGWDT